MKKRIIAGVLLLFLTLMPFFAVTGASAAATDEILDYTIIVTPYKDATLQIDYHIEWKVLDDSIGALEWVEVGMPNSDIKEYSAISDNISSLSLSGSGSNCLMRVDLDKKYYEGELVCFDFTVRQGHIYEAADEGKIRFYFTPGWFEGITVDHIAVIWNAADAESWTPNCFVEGDHLNFEGQLKPGARFTVQVTYPEDAFDVDIFEGYYDYEYSDDGYYYDGYSYEDEDDPFDAVLGFIFFILILAGIVKLFKELFSFAGDAALGKTYENKITRTKVEYYPTCQGCGAARPEGKETCEFCGRSFIKSEEKITETVKTPEAEEARTHTTAGTYHYGSIPNTYVRVNVTRVPIPRSSRPSSSSHRSSCVHSSCAHSSCACASHCACACACACAGGGRAGCSTKDFYNTGLKLSMMMKRAQKKQGN